MLLVNWHKQIREQAILQVKNIPGWRTRRKLLVIECDDWGGIRMPSAEVHAELLAAGLALKDDRFNRDTLAGAEDLDSLFRVLEGVTDSRGRSAVMTAVSNVANPDFEKIRNTGFQQYHYEPFPETLERYRGREALAKWHEGMGKGIFIPELHGREHITVQLWLRYLREGHPGLHKAFEKGLAAFPVMKAPLPARTFRPEFFFDSPAQKPFLADSLRDGIRLFGEIFGHSPGIFVPANAFFHPDFEKYLPAAGIRYLNVQHRTPIPDGMGGFTHRRYVTGSRSGDGLVYYTRNCAFEPAMDTYRGTGATLSQIHAAFRWGKPATISTHRVNFVGAIAPENREHGLKELKSLLEQVVRIWPEVEFLSSVDALNVMNSFERTR